MTNKDLSWMVDVPVLTVKGIKILLSLGTHLRCSSEKSQRIRNCQEGQIQEVDPDPLKTH